MDFKTPFKSFVSWSAPFFGGRNTQSSSFPNLHSDEAFDSTSRSAYNPLQSNPLINNDPFSTSSGGGNAANEDDLRRAKHLKANFILFSFFYSLIHAAVDCVIAFSAAELGTTLGAYGGFTLYIFYTLSSLFLAKPSLSYFSSSKVLITLGLFGLFSYVIGFYLAILFPVIKYELFLIGASIGGLGAGVLWTSQGVYYTLNAKLYSYYRNENKLRIIYNFAAIFAIFYLLLESVLQFVSTLIFYLYQQSQPTDADDDQKETIQTWRPIVFGVYTTLAAISLGLFWLVVMDFKEEEAEEQRQHHHPSQHSSDDPQNYHHHILPSSEIDELIDDEYEQIYFRSSHFSTQSNPASLASSASSSSSHHHPTLPSSSSHHHNRPQSPSDRSLTSSSNISQTKSSSMVQHLFAVTRAIVCIPKLQLLLPYQISFGLSAGLVQTYVNGVIVKDYIGDGYIGLLAGVITLTAVLIAQPLAWISNSYSYGKPGIMIVGSLCFSCGGIFLLCFSNHWLSQWGMIFSYYFLHGIARGIWENTNKAIIAEFFPQPHERDVSYASIYFASGLSGAMGFLFFQFLTKEIIAWINVIVSLLALIGYLFAQYLHDLEIREETLQHIHHLTDASSRSSSSSSSSNSLEEIMK